MSGAVSPPDIERTPLPAPEKPKIDPDLLKLVEKALLPLDALIKKPKVRQILEKEPVEEASRKIIERLEKERLANERHSNEQLSKAGASRDVSVAKARTERSG